VARNTDLLLKLLLDMRDSRFDVLAWNEADKTLGRYALTKATSEDADRVRQAVAVKVHELRQEDAA
jgi:hypothetical protein